MKTNLLFLVVKLLECVMYTRPLMVYEIQGVRKILEYDLYIIDKQVCTTIRYLLFLMAYK